MTGPAAVPWRLVDGLHDPSRATRLRVRARIRLARMLDAGMARAGLARPAVLVTGFWRSGTTWLQESLAAALGAKTVFEPLSPLDPGRGAVLARRFPGDEDAAQAYIPDAETAAAAFWAPLDRAMAGRADSSFALSCRWSVGESLRRTVVVKDVRLQCALRRAHARYGVPVVHLRRHPCAVVSSLVRADWHWSFARVRLAGLLPPPGAADGDGADPRGFDGDATARIAAAWAWSERRAAAALAGQPWGRLVTYEALMADPEAGITALCAGLGLQRRRGVAFDKPSATVAPDAFAAGGVPGDRWRRVLPAAEAARIEAIATAVYPRWRDAWVPA